MKIDFATMAFGYRVKAGGNTPNWATSLGQGKDYKININPQADELLRGMTYCSVPITAITTRIGKGGNVVSGGEENCPIISAAVFNKVYVNDQLINNSKFILIITRDNSKSHSGRLRLKYGPSNTYKIDDKMYSNEDFLAKARNQLNLNEKACWFVYDISIRNQDELILSSVIVDANKTLEYETSKDLHDAWKKLYNETDNNTEAENESMINLDCFESYKSYFYDLEERWVSEDVIVSHDISEFLKDYPLDYIKDMKPEQYVVGLGKDNTSLCYDIEFGKYKGIIGIGGGNALKFGIYYSKDEKSYKYKNELINIDDIWPDFISQLYSFLKEADSIDSIEKNNKYPLLKGMGMVLGKLTYIYNPDMYLGIASRKSLRKLMDYFDYPFSKSAEVYELSRDLKSNILKDLPELGNYGPSCIGNSLWWFLNDCINEDDEEIDLVDDEYSEMSLTEIIKTPRTRKLYPLNFILYGAPGTGKTYSTSEYAVGIIENFDINKTNMSRNEITEKYRHYIDKGQIVFTTFHQNYGYEEFIQGLRPDTSSNELSFKVCDGVFKSIADKALRDDQNDYVIIIDEINRGNISRVFGELITLIEEDKRWGEANEMYATLPYGEPFTVPNNLYIIGTMNSADKSISLVDTALRRRFNFIEKSPDLDLIVDVELRKVVNALNEYIVKELRSSDLVIGHSFFIGKTVKDLDTIMNEQIIPLLYEYFFEDEQKVKKALDAVSIAHYEDLDENGEKTTYVFTTSQKVFSRLQVCVEKKVGVNVE